MSRFLKLVLMLAFLFNCVPSVVSSSSANFYLLPSSNSVSPAEELTLSLFIEPDSSINISTFLLKLKFDTAKLKYTSIYSKYGKENFKAYFNGNELQVIFLTDEKGINIDSNDSVCFLEVNFKVLSDAAVGSTKVSGNVEGLGNYEAEKIPVAAFENTSLTISQSPQPDCNLSSLLAEDYSLSPAFDPNITHYEVQIPCNKSKLELTATAKDEDAKVKVSRTTLNAAGKSTDIKVTVTGSDGKARKIYIVTVKRLSKEETLKVEKSSSSSSSSKDSSGNGSEIVDLNEKIQKGTSLDSDGLVLVKGNFNFIVFFAISAICVIIAIYVIKKKDKKIK